MSHGSDEVFFPLLEGLAPDEKEAFLQLCEKKTYSKGARIFDEDKEAQTLYLLLEGCVELHFKPPGDRTMESTFVLDECAGQVIGWSALVPPYKYNLSGYCKSDTVVLEVAKQKIDTLLLTNYHMAFLLMRNIAGQVAQRLLQRQDQLIKCLGEEAIHGW